jgi:hypothetical protein
VYLSVCTHLVIVALEAECGDFGIRDAGGIDIDDGDGTLLIEDFREFNTCKGGEKGRRLSRWGRGDRLGGGVGVEKE